MRAGETVPQGHAALTAGGDFEVRGTIKPCPEGNHVTNHRREGAGQYRHENEERALTTHDRGEDGGTDHEGYGGHQPHQVLQHDGGNQTHIRDAENRRLRGVRRDRHRHTSASAAAGCCGLLRCRLLGTVLMGGKLVGCGLLDALLRRHLLGAVLHRRTVGRLERLVQLIRIRHTLRRNLHATGQHVDRAASRLRTQQVNTRHRGAAQNLRLAGRNVLDVQRLRRAVSHLKTQLRQAQQTRHQRTRNVHALHALQTNRAVLLEQKTATAVNRQIVQAVAGKPPVNRAANQNQYEHGEADELRVRRAEVAAILVECLRQARAPLVRRGGQNIQDDALEEAERQQNNEPEVHDERADIGTPPLLFLRYLRGRRLRRLRRGVGRNRGTH